MYYAIHIESMRINAYTRRMGNPAYRAGLRIALGIAQMVAAATAIAALAVSGVNRFSLLAATIASVLTVVSLLIFRK